MGSSRRGQSETIGIVLLLALTIVGTTAIVTFGSTALSDTEDNMRTGNVENSMKQLDARASRVAIGGSEAQGVTIPLQGSGSLNATPDAGWINVTVTDRDDGDRITITNVSLGAIIYQRGDTEIAYQGGGIWRFEDGGAVMVSSPEFHFREQTLTLPIVRVTSEGSLSSNVRVESNGSAERVFPNTTGKLSNPVAGNRQINVTIHSKYYEAWADFLETRAGGIVRTDDTNKTATIELVGSRPKTEGIIKGGIYATTTPSGTTVVLDDNSYIDSYNSDDYTLSDKDNTLPGEGDEEANVTLKGKIKLQSGNTEVRGSIRTANKVKVVKKNRETGDEHPDLSVTGHIFCVDMPTQGCLPGANRNDQVDFKDSADEGTSLDDGPDGRQTHVEEDLPTPPPVSERINAPSIDAKIDSIRNNNSNDDVSAIQSEEFKNQDVEIGPGKYYLANLNEQDQYIRLNLTKDGGGNISLAVDGKFKLDSDATLCVIYDDSSNHKVNVFLADGERLVLDNSADVITVDKRFVDGGPDDDDEFDCEEEGGTSNSDPSDLGSGTAHGMYNGTHMSNRFWVYAPPGLDTEHGQGTDFTGVIYAPGTTGDVASVTLGSGGRIYGAVVAFVDKMDDSGRDAAIYFDRRLKSVGAQPVGGSKRPSLISYLHITETKVNVTSSGGG